MKAEEMIILVNISFSLLELILRLQKENPSLSKDQVEKMADLIIRIKQLESKPDDYLESWKREVQGNE